MDSFNIFEIATALLAAYLVTANLLKIRPTGSRGLLNAKRLNIIIVWKRDRLDAIGHKIDHFFGLKFELFALETNAGNIRRSICPTWYWCQLFSTFNATVLFAVANSLIEIRMCIVWTIRLHRQQGKATQILIGCHFSLVSY